ncbi:cellulose biosynthesis protein BcsS [Hyphomicrobium sp.]|uniref:cellulose biosynthesis protein BcsS n=1 Tax=Hyphomicrobium sp. TaxID=82 RepID=UPI001DC34FF8|nr:cellulose biosynthesis protein BcsS [Hyphomicrobium sp.]MBY0561202.1 cellulose biosynthesis protein BcsS [Hyphomicrobium sp.]
MLRLGECRGCLLSVVAPSVIAVAQIFLTSAASAQASDPPTDWVQEKYGWREAYGGFDVARDQWLAYSGMTFALGSPDIYSDGWRLRLGGGYGRYGYDSIQPHTNCGDATSNDICGEDGRSRKHYQVGHSYAEVLLGYYLQLGRLTAKAFAGAAMSSKDHLKSDPDTRDDGTRYGVKGALEFWLTLSADSWTSLDLSYSTARNESGSQWRYGWRVSPKLSIGPELRYDKNVETGDGAWNGRAGLFTRYEWSGGEISLAGGGLWRVENWAAKNPSAYGTVNVLFQY